MSEPAHRNRNLPHFHLKQTAKPTNYMPPPRDYSGLPAPKRPDDVTGHGSRLESELRSAIEASIRQAVDAGVGAAPVSGGSYVSVYGRDSFALEVKKLESAGMVAVAHPAAPQIAQEEAGGEAQDAFNRDLVTVFVPDGKLAGVLKRLTAYASSPDKPKNEALIKRIGGFRRATLKMLWTDSPSQFPISGESIWWEVWLRDSLPGSAATRFGALAGRHQLSLGSGILTFPDRAVLLAKATPEQFESIMLECGDLAELRRARLNPQVFCDLKNAEQGEWARELADRLLILADFLPVIVTTLGPTVKTRSFQ